MLPRLKRISKIQGSSVTLSPKAGYIFTGSKQFSQDNPYERMAIYMVIC
jgi:hypothetical protein